jgi:prevent-host-death family protein
VPPERRRTIGEAKAHFAECIREAEAGRVTVLTRHGRPVAKLGPIKPSQREEDARASHEEDAEPATSGASWPASLFGSVDARRAALHRHLVEEIWPRIPKKLLGRGVSKRELEEILGYGSSVEPASGTGEP